MVGDALNNSNYITGRKFGHSEHAVREAKRRKQETGSQLDRPRSGRPPFLTPRDDRHIERIMLANKDKSADDVLGALREVDINVCADTIRASMKRTEIKRRVVCEKTLLKPDTIRQRQEWAAEYGEFDWRKVIYCDEVKVAMSSPIREYATRKDGKRLELENMRAKVPSSRTGMQLWGGDLVGRAVGTGPV
ncbi:hypothetical protein IAT40_006496 [Kwoniella sp. CBS 6097]